MLVACGGYDDVAQHGELALLLRSKHDQAKKNRRTAVNQFQIVLQHVAWVDVCFIFHIAQFRCEECYIKTYRTGSQYSTVGRSHSINRKRNP